MTESVCVCVAEGCARQTALPPQPQLPRHQETSSALTLQRSRIFLVIYFRAQVKISINMLFVASDCSLPSFVVCTIVKICFDLPYKSFFIFLPFYMCFICLRVCVCARAIPHLSVPFYSPLCCLICVYFRHHCVIFTPILLLPTVSLSVFTLKHARAHPPTRTHTRTHTVSCSCCCCAVLQMPQCAVISWEIWGCYKLCRLDNRRQRMPPLYRPCAATLRGRVFGFACTADTTRITSAH